MEIIDTNKLLAYFDVSNHAELMTFMKQNPNHPKVQELQEFLRYVESQKDKKS